MSDLGKKVGYLKGLMEGMDFSGEPSKEKLFGAMADLLGELSDRVESMEELLDDLNDYVESIDDDLAELEGNRTENDFRFMDDENEDEFFDDTDDSEDHLHLLGGKNDDLPDEGETLAGVICPECEKMFFVDAGDPEDAQYTCPHCSKRIAPNPLTPENAPIAKPEKE